MSNNAKKMQILKVSVFDSSLTIRRDFTLSSKEESLKMTASLFQQNKVFSTIPLPSNLLASLK